MPRARLAIDIGGTFTDVALEADGRLFTVKALTTRAAPEQGVMAGVAMAMRASAAGESGDAARAVRPDDVGLAIHGTTLATNAIIERKGARTALLTTAGHRDALEMAHENRFEQYDVGVDRPPPLVPRRLRLPVTERVDRNGRVLVPLDEKSLRALLPILDDAGVEAVAVGFIHGYANPSHEQRVREFLAAERPRVAVTLASEVCPEVREYERLSTACANAYVQPLMSRYLKGLADSLRKAGFSCPFLLMTSSGGLATLATAVAAPVRLVESGPAGGAILAAHLARTLGLGDVLSFDMGGTTAKLCIVDGGRPLTSRTFEVARSYRFQKGSGLPVRVPVIEMVEIGAGGGSIAEVDDLGRVRVGPASAGSDPGPAAYGLGGERPTVTDADLTLGRLDPALFAGGAIPLDAGAAAAAIDGHVGTKLGIKSAAAARAICEVVDENMANAARTHAAEWGKAMAGRALVAFGGAAPIHAARLAEKLEIDRIVVPRNAGVGSAVGFLLAPISYEVVRSRYMRLSRFDAPLVSKVLAEMRAEAAEVVSQGAPGAAADERARAYMRYAGQGHEIGVDLPDGIEGEDGGPLLREAFDCAYEAMFGRAIPGLDVEVLSWTLALAAAVEADDHQPTADRAPTDAMDDHWPTAEQVPTEGRVPTADRVRSMGSLPAKSRLRAEATLPATVGTTAWATGADRSAVPVAPYRRRELTLGDRVLGPALVTEAQTTTVVPAGFQAETLPSGDLLLVRGRLARDQHAGGEQANRPAAPPPTPPGAGTTVSPGPSAGTSDASPTRPEAGSETRGVLDGQIMWSRLLSVVEEQAQTLVRTAFSTPVREAGDLSAGVFDVSGRMLAQAVTGTPGHVNAMAESVVEFLAEFPAHKLSEGDVLVTNDPWKGTGHLNDFTVVTPAFHRGRLAAFFAATSHIADVGGRGFGADAGQVYEEGIRIPIGHLIRDGRLDATLMRLVRANVREPDVAEGDLHSLVACNRTGRRRLSAMMTEFGIDSIAALADSIVDTSRRSMLERIGRLKPGAYRNRATIDGYDRDLELHCVLTVSSAGIRIDFDGSSPASEFGINVPLTYTRAYASFGVRCIVGPDVPNNAGSLGVVEVAAPPGSLLDAPFPSAVSARHAVGQMLPDVVLGCLSQAMDEPVPAEGASCLWNPVLMGGRGLSGGDYRDSAPFVVNPFHTGGTGARPGKDGLSATAFPSGVRSTPVEITETVAPLIFWRKEYIADSGGPGQYRGGLGQVMEVAHADGAPFAVSKMFERIRNPARGRDGGAPGAPGRVRVVGPHGGELRGKGKEVVPRGHRLVMETPGGGGLGDPRRRDPAMVERDVRNGYVSAEAAARVYGATTKDEP